jgi:two-component system phosphate regulon sensor histidine kinase PhoR
VASGSDGGAVLVLHDITDLRKAGQIRQDFVANVSHELRTPLTAIRGYVEALLDEPALGTEARGFLDIIGRHTRAMERLVKDLLRLARLDARQEPLERTRCSVRDAFDAVLADLAPQVEAGSNGSRSTFPPMRPTSTPTPASCTTSCATWSRTP